MKNIYTTIAFSLLAMVATAQCEINIQIKGLRDTDLYLGYRFENKHYALDTARIDRKGNAVFKNKTAQHKGIYFVALPNHQSFDFLMTDNQKFSIITDTASLYRRNLSQPYIQFKNSPENAQFIEYQQFIEQQHLNAQRVLDAKKSEQCGKDCIAKYDAELDSIDLSVKNYIVNAIAKNKNNFLSTILTILKPIDNQSFAPPEGTLHGDSIQQQRQRYEYMRDHYFDDVNFAENGLLYTPFFKSRIEYFFKNLIVPHPDTVIKYVDKVIARSKQNDEMYRYITELFFQYYQKSEIMLHDTVVVHIADNYYLTGAHPWWADSTYLERIKERMDKMRPTLIGKVAPDLFLQDLDGNFISLSTIQADYIILCFFEPSCSHCQVEVPKLWDLYQTVRDKNVKVCAVYTQYKRAEWEKFVRTDHQFDWINLWDGVEGKDEKGEQITYSLGSRFQELYDVHSTPVIFLLDKNKRILAKRIGVETLKEILNSQFTIHN